MNIPTSITNPINKELDAVTQMLDADFNHSNPILGPSLSYIASHPGKMVRPVLTLLTAQLFAPITPAVRHIAACYESFHTASLVHDDVVDQSATRRGHHTINHAAGNKVAVLVGDYILSMALKHLAATNNPQLIQILSTAASQLAHGELLQMANANTRCPSEETYINIISAKTAALFAACTTSAAIVSGADNDEIERMTQFGHLVGLCFQMRDDIFDYYTGQDIGKPTGHDLAEGKLTLPVIYVLGQPHPSQMDTAISMIQQGTAKAKDIEQIIDITIQKGGIEYATKVMNGYAELALNIINTYPDTPTRQAMSDYVHMVIHRNL